MNWNITIATYGVAYLFLSFCVALVVGRLLRTMQPPSLADDAGIDDAPESRWMSHQEPEPAGLFGQLAN
jgi:hypothetical protein